MAMCTGLICSVLGVIMVTDTLIRRHPKNLKDLFVSSKTIKLCGICVLIGLANTILIASLTQFHRGPLRNALGEEIAFALVILCVTCPGFWIPLGYLLTNDRAKVMFRRSFSYFLTFVGVYDPTFHVST